MNNIFYGFLVFFAFISLVGGLNWLMTAINSWNNDFDSVIDLLQDQLKMPADVANIVYIIVFISTLALFLMVAFPQNLKKAFSGMSSGISRRM